MDSGSGCLRPDRDGTGRRARRRCRRLADFTAKGGDGGGTHRWGGAAEGVAGVGEDGGDLFVVLKGEGCHAAGEVVLLPFDGDGTLEAAQLDEGVMRRFADWIAEVGAGRLMFVSDTLPFSATRLSP